MYLGKKARQVFVSHFGHLLDWTRNGKSDPGGFGLRLGLRVELPAMDGTVAHTFTTAVGLVSFPDHKVVRRGAVFLELH